MANIRNGKRYYTPEDPQGNVAENTYENAQRGQKRVNDLIASGSYRDVPRNTLGDYLEGRISEDEAVAQITRVPFNPSAGPQIDVGQGPQPMKIGTTPGTGFNAPGQGFYTPEIIANQQRVARERLSAMSTQQVSGVPERIESPAPVLPSLADFLKGFGFTGIQPPAEQKPASERLAEAKASTGFCAAQTELQAYQEVLRNF